MQSRSSSNLTEQYNEDMDKILNTCFSSMKDDDDMASPESGSVEIPPRIRSGTLGPEERELATRNAVERHLAELPVGSTYEPPPALQRGNTAGASTLFSATSTVAEPNMLADTVGYDTAEPTPTDSTVRAARQPPQHPPVAVPTVPTTTTAALTTGKVVVPDDMSELLGNELASDVASSTNGDSPLGASINRKRSVGKLISSGSSAGATGSVIESYLSSAGSIKKLETESHQIDGTTAQEGRTSPTEVLAVQEVQIEELVPMSPTKGRANNASSLPRFVPREPQSAQPPSIQGPVQARTQTKQPSNISVRDHTAPPQHVPASVTSSVNPSIKWIPHRQTLTPFAQSATAPAPAPVAAPAWPTTAPTNQVRQAPHRRIMTPASASSVPPTTTRAPQREPNFLTHTAGSPPPFRSPGLANAEATLAHLVSTPSTSHHQLSSYHHRHVGGIAPPPPHHAVSGGPVASSFLTPPPHNTALNRQLPLTSPARPYQQNASYRQL